MQPKSLIEALSENVNTAIIAVVLCIALLIGMQSDVPKELLFLLGGAVAGTAKP